MLKRRKKEGRRLLSAQGLENFLQHKTDKNIDREKVPRGNCEKNSKQRE